MFSGPQLKDGAGLGVLAGVVFSKSIIENVVDRIAEGLSDELEVREDFKFWATEEDCKAGILLEIDRVSDIVGEPLVVADGNSKEFLNDLRSVDNVGISET